MPPQTLLTNRSNEHYYSENTVNNVTRLNSVKLQSINRCRKQQKGSKCIYLNNTPKSESDSERRNFLVTKHALADTCSGRMVSSDVESYTAMTEIENLTQSWAGMCLHISLCQQTCTIVCTIKQKHLMKRDQRTYNKTLNIIKVGEKKKLICKKMKSNITKILIKKILEKVYHPPLE